MNALGSFCVDHEGEARSYSGYAESVVRELAHLNAEVNRLASQPVKAHGCCVFCDRPLDNGTTCESCRNSHHRSPRPKPWHTLVYGCGKILDGVEYDQTKICNGCGRSAPIVKKDGFGRDLCARCENTAWGESEEVPSRTPGIDDDWPEGWLPYISVDALQSDDAIEAAFVGNGDRPLGISCLRCETMFATERGFYRHLDGCRNRHDKLTRRCLDCGVDIGYRRRQSSRCPRCARAEKQRQYRIRHPRVTSGS